MKTKLRTKTKNTIKMKMNRALVLALPCACALALTFGQSHRAVSATHLGLIAVFDIESSGLSLGEKARGRLKSYLATKLAGRGYQIVAQDKLKSRLRQQKLASYRRCYDASCQIAIGRELAAQKALAPKVLRLGEKCVVALTVFDLKTAATERAADAHGRCSIGALAQAVDRAVGSLTTNRGARQKARPLAMNGEGVAISGFGYLAARVKTQKKAQVMPLRHTAVKAKIVGVISSVQVTQVYENPYDHPIEAVYVFALPHRAAVHAMKMQIGKRQVVAVIKRRKEARKLYEKAKKKGKTAALLEQERPNVFTQSVANIMPGDTIKVVLSYVEELTPTDGQYEFVFPMVVGPRYVNASVKDGAVLDSPLLAPGVRPGRDISLSLTIDGGMPIENLRALTHRVRYTAQSRTRRTLEIAAGDRLPNRDFVVRYQLAGKKPQLTVLSEHDGKRGHFLLMVQPKRKMQVEDIAPREYVFVVDISGSMSGAPLGRAKAIIKRSLSSLRADDRFQIILFAGDAVALAPRPLIPSAENLRRARAFIDDAAGGGGTEFLPALKLAFEAPKPPKRARMVVFISDGYIGNEAEVLRFIRRKRGGSNLFSFGVGSSVNRFLIDGMARLGHGRPFIVLNGQGAGSAVERLFSLISKPALTSVSVEWSGLAVRDLTPTRPPDLFGDRPLLLTGRYKKAGKAEITVRGYLAGKQVAYRYPLTLAPPSKDGAKLATRPGSSPLGNLWARRRIAELMDYYRMLDEQHRLPSKNAVTKIALDYSLISKFTSFVAIDRFTRNEHGDESRRVAIASPLPKGVGQSAAAPHRFVSASASLSTDQFVPGDPEVRIDAPQDTKKVTLIFPTGEIKACEKEARSGQWLASFLIPQETPDGIYSIIVLITRGDGRQMRRRVSYQVDGTAPKFKVELPHLVTPNQTLRLTLHPKEISTLKRHGRHSAPNIGDPSFAARIHQEISRGDNPFVKWPHHRGGAAARR